MRDQNGDVCEWQGRRQTGREGGREGGKKGEREAVVVNDGGREGMGREDQDKGEEGRVGGEESVMLMV